MKKSRSVVKTIRSNTNRKFKFDKGSPFHPRAQRNASRRRGARLQSKFVRLLERCPQCGAQALYCECPYDDDLIAEPSTKI